jgi:hypothetical protein
MSSSAVGPTEANLASVSASMDRSATARAGRAGRGRGRLRRAPSEGKRARW